MGEKGKLEGGLGIVLTALIFVVVFKQSLDIPALCNCDRSYRLEFLFQNDLPLNAGQVKVCCLGIGILVRSSQHSAPASNTVIGQAIFGAWPVPVPIHECIGL